MRFIFLIAVALLSEQLGAQIVKVFPTYHYFFNDEQPTIHLAAKGEGYFSVLSKSGRILFADHLKASEMKPFLLPVLDKKEMQIIGDGSMWVPVAILIEKEKGKGGEIIRDTLKIQTLLRKDNAVRLHHPSGLLETSLTTQRHHVKGEKRSLFFPFGFYARERDDFDWILRTEAMNGFNLYSPYQNIEDSTLARRKSYMDLCADLGIRVNYNLQNVCALKSSDSPEVKKEKLRKIKQEVKALKDHPALLSWYVSDEPDGQFISPAELKEAVDLVRKLDPYHPISMVFVDPKPSLPYRDLLDIVMTDPYPIPGNSVVNAGEYLEKLKEYYQFEKNIWIVPQAFGGQEFWSREPTAAELRAMVYLGVIHGARASQAFIRHVGESFPKNPAMWAAYHQCARELQYLAKDLQYLNEVDSAIWKTNAGAMKLDMAIFNGENPNIQTFIIVNQENKHKVLNLPVDGRYADDGVWNFIFEDRKVNAGEIFDIVLNPFEVKVLRFERRTLNRKELEEKEWQGNKIKDYSFEKWTAVGVPTACYLHMSKEHGATAWLDRSIAHHGELSLRLNNLGGDKVQDQSQEVSFYQFSTIANHAYVLSFWAYAEQSTPTGSVENVIALRMEKPWGQFIWKDTIEVKSGWNRYDIPYFPKQSEDRNMLELRILKKGFVWLDQIQWVESPTIETKGEIFDSVLYMHAQTIAGLYPLKNIRYTYFPTGADTIYNGNLERDLALNFSGYCEVSYPLDNGEVQKIPFPIRLRYHKIPSLRYIQEPSLKYLAGGENALIDGVLGEFVWDGKWQGFEGVDFEGVVTAPENKSITSIEVRALSKKSAWVYWPLSIEIWGSQDGMLFEPLQTISTPDQAYTAPEGIYTYQLGDGIAMDRSGQAWKYYKIKANSMKKLPTDHPFVGEKSWLFIDEILLH